MNFRRLLIIHALVTFAAGVVLIVKPGLIPGAVDIQLDPAAYLICYLLASSEFSMAILSFFGRKLKDAKAIRVIALSCIVLHASSGILEGYALMQGLSPYIWVNIGLRVLAVSLLWYYGYHRTVSRNEYIRRG